MTTLDYLVKEVESRALSGFRQDMTVLGADCLVSDTTITLAAGVAAPSVEAGAMVEVDYELMAVLARLSASTAQVRRAVLNSAAAFHASGTPLVVNPRFPAVDIVRAVNEDIDDLSGPTNGLYQMKVLALTYNPAITGYDLPGLTNDDVLEVRELRAWDYGSQQAWPLIPTSDWKLERNASYDVFPSGLSIKVYNRAFPGRPIRVQYKAPYSTPLADPDDDVAETTGLHAQAHDIPVLGAAYRLMMFRELKRSFTEAQGEPRRAAEVPVGSSLTALKGIQQLRGERIANERERLNKMHKQQRRV
jgi:hypothetical protein